MQTAIYPDRMSLPVNRDGVRRVVRGLRTRDRLRRMAREAGRFVQPSAPTTRTYDVFDTVLTRTTGTAEDSVRHLARRLSRAGLLTVPAQEFARLRCRAEERAYAERGGVDSGVDLEAVYDVLGRTAPGAVTNLDVARSEELQHELDVLRAVGEVRPELLDPHRDAVTFISDTHHSGAFLEQALRGQQVFRDGDRVITSSDEQRSKASGDLYQAFLAATETDPTTVVHRGNDPWTDWAQARRAGIAAHPFPQGNFTRYEELLAAQSADTDGLAGRLAGAARVARLSVSVTDRHGAALRDVAAGVAAPVVVGFVLWALERARAQGVRTLCFVARDGQVLHDVATRLVRSFGWDMQVHYIYGSRQAWSLAGLDVGAPGAADVFTQAADVDLVSAAVLTPRFGIECEEAAAVLSSQGLPRERWDDPLGPQERAALASALLAHPEVGALIGEKAEEQRALLLDYLKGEGVLDGAGIVLVDVSTGGTLHHALASVLRLAGEAPPRSLILGRRAKSLVGEDVTVQTWFPPEDSGLEPALPDGLVPALEVFALADHETTLGYERREDGRVHPVLKAGDGAAARRWGQPLVREAITMTVDNLVLDEEDLYVDLREAVTGTFREFWWHPRTVEARAWSGAALEDGWGEHSLPVRIAEPFESGQLLRSTLRRGGEPVRAVRTWRAGSLRLSSRPVGVALRLGFAARGLLRDRRSRAVASR